MLLVRTVLLPSLFRPASLRFGPPCPPQPCPPPYHATTPCPPPYHPMPTSQHPPTVFFTNAFVRSVIFFSIPCNAPPTTCSYSPALYFSIVFLQMCIFHAMPSYPPVTCSHHPSPTIRASLEPSMVQVTMTNDVQESKDGFSDRVGWEPDLGEQRCFFLDIFFESFFSF